MITTSLNPKPESGKLPLLILKVAEWIDNEAQTKTSIALEMVRGEASEEPSYWKSLFSLLDPMSPTSVYEWKTYTADDMPDELIEEVRDQLREEHDLPLCEADKFYRHAVALTVHDVVLAAKIRRFLRNLQ